MGFSSERFCHAAIGRLMDGDRGYWFLFVCVVRRPHIHTHLSLHTRGPAEREKEELARASSRCRPAQMMSSPLLPFPPRCVIHIQVHSAGVHASPTDIYIYIHRLFYI